MDLFASLDGFFGIDWIARGPGLPGKAGEGDQFTEAITLGAWRFSGSRHQDQPTSSDLFSVLDIGKVKTQTHRKIEGDKG